jgi:hypothetical protein
MRLFLTLLLPMLLLAGCAPEAEKSPVVAQQVSVPDMIELEIGRPLPGFEAISTENAPGGMVIVDLPMPAGRLSHVFDDYSVQLDPTTRHVISASATRTFLSFDDCQARFNDLAVVLKSKYQIDAKSVTGPASLQASIGPMTVELVCSIKLDAGFPTLSLWLADKSLTTQAYERAIQRDGR